MLLRHSVSHRRALRHGLVLLALALTVTTAHAHERRDARDRHDFDVWQEGRLVDVQVRVAGEATPLYVAPGREDRRYLQAFAGRPYEIVLRNTTSRRVAVVVSVDGLNVISGERSALESNEGMYVLAPRETATLRGWRTSLDEVRRFVFVDERRSYAERTGQANADMGWIRVASFREQRPWSGWSRGRLHTFEGGAPGAFGDAPPTSAMPKSAAPAPLAGGEERSVPGTGWGDRRDDRVNTTTFLTDGEAVDRLILRYEYESGLRALGVLPSSPRWRDRLAERDGGFARPPRW